MRKTKNLAMAKAGKSRIGEKNQERKPRRSISADDKANMALDRFEGYREDGKLTLISVLGKKYDRAPAVVIKAIKSAFAEHLVEVVKTPRAGPMRIDGLEAELLEQFPHLRRAIVIETPTREDIRRTEPIHEPLYEDLGKVLARMLMESELIQDETWCIGSGRGCWSTLHALHDMEPRLRGAVTAVSLTGNFFQRGDTPQGFWLNGDHNVALFGSSFDDYKARLELVNYPLVYRDRAAMQGVLKATCLASTRWNALGVQKGLIGVGMAIAPGRKLEDNAPDLQPIRDHVTRLREACDSLVGADRYEKWVPVCDTANLLIWVPPPKDFPKVPDQATVSRIKEDLLPEVNARLLTVTEEQLKSVPSLVLVAGSVQKAPAIYKWMRDFKIRYLCTDSSAAERLLEIASIGTYE